MEVQEIKIPFGYTMSDTAIPRLKELADDYGRVRQTTYENGMLVMKCVQGVITPSFDDLKTIVTNGGSFKFVRLGIRILASKFNTEVPVGIPNRTYLNEEEKEVVRTWKQWAEAGNIQYVLKQDNSDAIFRNSWGGHSLPSEVMAKIHTTVGLTVLDWQELIDLCKSIDYGGEVEP